MPLVAVVVVVVVGVVVARVAVVTKVAVATRVVAEVVVKRLLNRVVVVAVCRCAMISQEEIATVHAATTRTSCVSS